MQVAQPRAGLSLPRPGPRAAATIVVVVMAAVVFVVVVNAVRGLIFLQDEWVFVTQRRDPSIQSLLQPYNNHWQAIPILAYQAALALRGLGAYGLLAGMGAASHVLAALALFAALRGVRPWLAVVAAAALMAFAWSDEVLLWPVNMSFSLPVAFGFSTIALWSRPVPRPLTDGLGTLALILAFMSGGVAIPIAAVATAVVLLRSGDRRRLAWPAAAWVVYVAWYVTFGRTGDALGNALASDLTLLPLFVAHGLASLAAPALGQDFRYQELALLLIAAALGLAAGRVGRRPLIGWIALAGVALLYAVVGLARIRNYDVQGAGAPRYAYPAFALLLFGAAPIVNQLFDSLGSQRGRRLLAAGVAGWLAVALIGDAGKLSRSASAYAERAADIRTELWLLETLRPAIESGSAADERVDKRWFGDMTPRSYYAAIDDIGDLPGPSGSLRRWRAHPRGLADEALGRWFSADLALRPLSTAPTGTISSADRLYGLHDMEISAGTSGCASFTVSGSDPFVAVRLRDGESIAVRTDGQRALQVFSSVLADQFGAIEHSILPVPGTWYAITPPRLGEAWPWHLRVDAPPASSRLELCLLPAARPS